MIVESNSGKYQCSPPSESGRNAQSSKVWAESLLDLRTVRIICGVKRSCPGDEPKGDRRRERGNKTEREMRESRQVDNVHPIFLQSFIRQRGCWIRTVYSSLKGHIYRRPPRIPLHQRVYQLLPSQRFTRTSSNISNSVAVISPSKFICLRGTTVRGMRVR